MCALLFDNRMMIKMMTVTVMMMIILLLMVTMKNKSVSNIMHPYLDSGNEASDNGGSEGTDIPLQAAYKAITIELESNSYSGNHELAGTDRTIPATDYWARQSQLAGTQSHQSTKLNVHEIKHHVLITNGSSISMTTEGVIVTNEVCIYKYLSK